MKDKTAMTILAEWCNITPPQTRHACLEAKIIELLETEKQQHEQSWEASILSFAQMIGNDMSEEKELDIPIYRSFGDYYNDNFETPERDNK